MGWFVICTFSTIDSNFHPFVSTDFSHDACINFVLNSQLPAVDCVSMHASVPVRLANDLYSHATCHVLCFTHPCCSMLPWLCATIWFSLHFAVWARFSWQIYCEKGTIMLCIVIEVSNGFLMVWSSFEYFRTAACEKDFGCFLSMLRGKFYSISHRRCASAEYCTFLWFGKRSFFEYPLIGGTWITWHKFDSISLTSIQSSVLCCNT